ncbi:MAG: peptidylprolyl isomerase, partial [Acidobacteriota bacterium]|nr:peptidylprolyl isomerase [Acidobacteriota bacterium]
SQWFVTHSPQPHLDGGYTVFGRVREGMEVVDAIARGDRIRSISVTETIQK